MVCIENSTLVKRAGETGMGIGSIIDERKEAWLRCVKGGRGRLVVKQRL